MTLPSIFAFCIPRHYAMHEYASVNTLRLRVLLEGNWHPHSLQVSFKRRRSEEPNCRASRILSTPSTCPTRIPILI